MFRSNDAISMACAAMINARSLSLGESSRVWVSCIIRRTETVFSRPLL